MKRIKGLDGMRGFASIAIVAFHTAILGGYTGYISLFDRTVARGDCWVRMFFMLTSFSLLCGYHGKYTDKKFDLEVFYKRRIKRIFPVFLIVMLAHGMLNAYLGSPNNIFEFIGTGSMLFALLPSNQDSIVWAGWSMGIQMVFYLFFPAFLVMVKTKKRTLIAFASSILLYFAYTNYYGVGVQNEHISIVRQFIYFVMGAMIFHFQDFFENLERKQKLFMSLLCVLIEILCFIMFAKINEDFVMIVAFSALMILQLMDVDYLMNNKLMLFLGKISFEIYLIHPVVYRLCAISNFGEWLIGLNKLCAFFVHFIVILILTIIFSCLLNIFMKQFSKQETAKE